MLQPVAVGSKTLADSTHIFGRDQIAEIRELAEPLQGLRVAHMLDAGPAADPTWGAAA